MMKGPANGRAYLDWNATAPLRGEARAAMIQALELAGNPSSVHAEGRVARRAVELARAQVAAVVGADPSGVIFTSGGTEANALALSPGWTAGRGKAGPDRLLVSAIEHPSVLQGGRFAAERTSRIPVTPRGAVDLDALRDLLKGGPALVSVMLANNETGIIQPIREVAEIVHEAGGLLHVDAIQTIGRIVCNFNDLFCDLLTISAHKIGGPKGAGALIRRESLHLADPLIRGGGQERGLRAGTENVAAIAGFGAAAQAAGAAGRETEAAHMLALRERLEAGLRAVAPEVVLFGKDQARLPNTTLFTHPGLRAETAVIAFDLEGVAVSSGSACSSGKVQPSHVLEAMAVEPELSRGAIRISTGSATTDTDIDQCLSAWLRLSESLLKGRKTIAA
jgi:cysteine desulfurase